MKYQLIATDFDYTLVGNSKTISKENKGAIQKAIDSGVQFVLCSGRSFVALENFEKELNLIGENIYGICFNGSMIYETNTRKKIYEKLLKNDTSRKILLELKKFDVSIIVYIQENLYIEDSESQYIKDYEKRCLIPMKEVNKLEELNNDFSKILVTGSREKLVEVYEHMKQMDQGKYNVFFSFDTLLEFTHPEATKGNALSYLAQYLNISMDHVIAIGDNYNDISMIQQAGMGIAVANAVEALKSEANYITKNTCENHAVKEVIEQFIV